MAPQNAQHGFDFRIEQRRLFFFSAVGLGRSAGVGDSARAGGGESEGKRRMGGGGEEKRTICPVFMAFCLHRRDPWLVGWLVIAEEHLEAKAAALTSGTDEEGTCEEREIDGQAEGERIALNRSASLFTREGKREGEI